MQRWYTHGTVVATLSDSAAIVTSASLREIDRTHAGRELLHCASLSSAPTPPPPGARLPWAELGAPARAARGPGTLRGGLPRLACSWFGRWRRRRAPPSAAPLTRHARALEREAIYSVSVFRTESSAISAMDQTDASKSRDRRCPTTRSSASAIAKIWAATSQRVVRSHRVADFSRDLARPRRSSRSA
jgi:hypothetical protein